MGEIFHMVTTLLSASAPTPTPEPTELQPSATWPDLLTEITNAITAIAIVVGGAFAYLKFIKGRVLNAATLVEINATLTSRPLAQHLASPRPGALLVEMVIRNNAQSMLTIPKDSEQLVYVRSVTEEELTRAGQDLTQHALSWKCPDAYYAEANILLLDQGQEHDIPLGPGGAITLTAVFPVPSGHNAAAFLVAGYSWTVSGSWPRRSCSWTEGRTLVVPGHESG